MNKTIKVIGMLLITSISFLLVSLWFNKKLEYSKNIYYMDTYIYVEIYEKNKDVANDILDEVESIYRNYHQLTDRYNHYDGIINVSDIYNNNFDDEILTLDSKLYEILEYAERGNEKYSKFNIEIGNIIDVWKKYRENKNGVPTLEELETSITELVLLDNNSILNNHPNLDLGSITKGFATEKVGEYLESKGIYEYLINAGGNVKVGKSYNKKHYKIGIQSPNAQEEILTIVNGENISVVSSGGYERNYEYNGNIYHHIIDPETLYPANYIKGVTVLTKDSALGDYLSTSLFLMSVDDGLEFIKEYEAEAIWYTNDNQIIRSEKFKEYE